VGRSRSRSTLIGPAIAEVRPHARLTTSSGTGTVGSGRRTAVGPHPHAPAPHRASDREPLVAQPLLGPALRAPSPRSAERLVAEIRTIRIPKHRDDDTHRIDANVVRHVWNRRRFAASALRPYSGSHRDRDTAGPSMPTASPVPSIAAVTAGSRPTREIDHSSVSFRHRYGTSGGSKAARAGPVDTARANVTGRPAK
jgi:hypothetical protein